MSAPALPIPHEPEPTRRIRILQLAESFGWLRYRGPVTEPAESGRHKVIGYRVDGADPLLPHEVLPFVRGVAFAREGAAGIAKIEYREPLA